ncbi:hypothetical protein Tco_0255192 [Tanacetum coccineum]
MLVVCGGVCGGGGGSGMVMEEETRWWQQWGGDDGVDLVAVVGGVGGGEDGGDVVDIGLGWMVVGVAAAVAGDAGDGAENSPEKQKGEGVNETQERQDDDLMFDTGVLDDVEMPVEAKVDRKGKHSTKPDDSTAGEAVTTASVKVSVVPTTIEEITLAQTLIQIKAAKPKIVTTAATTTVTTRPKDREVVVQEPSAFRVPQETQPLSSNDKGKGIMIELEVPLKRKDQIAFDERIARDIQAKLDDELIEEQKLVRKQEEEANIALIESWENTQAMRRLIDCWMMRIQSKEERSKQMRKSKIIYGLMEKEKTL